MGTPVVMEGWLWKKKGSTMGSIFKSVTRRYCVLKEKGIFECYDDQGGELLTNVQIKSAKVSGKWLYIKGFNKVKSTNCFLRFQGDFENDTTEWSEKVLEVVDLNFGGRSRGETQGLFFEDGEKRASAFVPKVKDEKGKEEEDVSESSNEEVQEEETKPKDEKAEEKKKAEGEGEEPNRKPEENAVSPTPDEKTNSASEEKKEAESAAEKDGEPKSETDPSKAASLWRRPTRKTTQAAPPLVKPEAVNSENDGEKRSAARSAAASKWMSAGATVASQKKKKKKLYGADLLKHLAMQQVQEMKVSKEAAEMERWKAKCELGDECNPTKQNIECFACNERITDSYIDLHDNKYHKDCFVCEICSVSVRGGAYQINGILYCENHRLDIYPKCIRCEKDILGKYIVGPNRNVLHPECFSCKDCGRKIRTFCEHDNEIFCVTCYSSKYASKCYACKQPLKDKIRTLQSEEAKGMKWHEGCFKCSTCHKRLNEKVFFQDKKLHCEYCMKKSHLPSCSKCKMPVEGSCINALDGSWHPKCFVCAGCQSPLKGFIAKDGKPHCKACFDKIFAETCDMCGEPIKGAFLSAIGKKFHDTCFKCCNCSNAIDGSFMKSPDGLPACSKDCLAEYYKNVILPKKNPAEA